MKNCTINKIYTVNNFLLVIILFQMLKPISNLPKLNKSVAQRKRSLKINSENQKPLAFNTKGYFDPSQPFDESYLQAKQKVFQKYRQKQQDYVMLDIKNINRPAFIRRVSLRPQGLHQRSQDNGASQTLRDSLLKNYLIRKERKGQIENEKYFLESPKINTDILQSRLSTGSKTYSRNVSSWVSNNSHVRSEIQF